MAAANDGRALRGIRNRERIAESLFELISEGILIPTAEQVAQRADVSSRSVFRHYEDMEGLFSEVAARVRANTLPLLVIPEGTLVQRLRTLVSNRSLIFERIALFKRASETQRWRSALLQQDHARMVSELRTGITQYLPEFANGPHLEIADLLTSFQAWDRMRTDQGLSPEATEAHILSALGRLLGLHEDGEATA